LRLALSITVPIDSAQVGDKHREDLAAEGDNQLPEALQGVTFRNGAAVTNTPGRAPPVVKRADRLRACAAG
jgi:hypothetical protein